MQRIVSFTAVGVPYDHSRTMFAGLIERQLEKDHIGTHFSWEGGSEVKLVIESQASGYPRIETAVKTALAGTCFADIPLERSGPKRKKKDGKKET